MGFAPGRFVAQAIFVVAFATACVTRPQFLQPSPVKEFPAVLSSARQAATAGRYGDADRQLAEFSVRYPGTREAAETAYWRALLQLDPANRDGSITTALAELDQYLGGSSTLPHYQEATTLRRLGAELQTATRLATASVTTQTTTTTRTVPDDKSRDEEIQRLKDQLQKANDELDRIKKRLAAPTRP